MNNPVFYDSMQHIAEVSPENYKRQLRYILRTRNYFLDENCNIFSDTRNANSEFYFSM